MKIIQIYIILLLSGCTAQQWKAIGTSLAASASNSYSSGYNNVDTKVMFFGGINNSVYLGCFSCTKFETDSIFNQYNDYGSKYSNTSIFNSYSDYGSKYSDYSPCNTYASSPPVIVDQSGSFYGYLTLNKYHSGATKNGNILAWLAGVCASS